MGESPNDSLGMSSRRHTSASIGDVVLKFCTDWFPADFFSVGLFAFGGVALRMAITSALAGHVDPNVKTNTGPFLQIFYAHPDLASNMLGSFIVAMCLSFLGELTTLSPALYKGITVGFCGCLTTLSSWMFNTFFQVMEGSSWYELFIVVVLEFYLIWASFNTGLGAARLARELSSHLVTEARNESPEIGPAASQDVGSIEADVELEPIASEPPEARSPSPESSSERCMEVASDYSEAHEAATEEGEHKNMSSTRISRGTLDLLPSDAPDESVHSVAIAQSRRNFVTEYEYALWAVTFCVVALTVWAVLIALPYIGYYKHTTYRDTYRSVALAPFGAWLRWALTRFPSIKALWPEMHPQTLIANIAAVTIMSAVSVSSQNSWVVAIDAGFCGSFSTVSTFMVELHTMYVESGARISLRYAVATILTSAAIVQISRVGAS